MNHGNTACLGGPAQKPVEKEAPWILYSFDVKLDGKNACRLSAPEFLHCGKPVNEDHEKLPKMDDQKLMDDANALPKDRRTHAVGGIKTGDTTAFANSFSPGVGPICNLKTKLPIPISPDKLKELEAKGNAVGNCCEQKLLTDVFITKGLPFPPKDC